MPTPAPPEAARPTPAAEREAAEACAREPIHIPGAIQPHGVLLAVNAALDIVHASENASARLNRAVAPGAPLAQALPELLTNAAGESLRAWLTGGEGPFLGSLEIDGACHSLIANRARSLVILELESETPGERTTLDTVYPDLRAFVGELQAMEDQSALFTLAARRVRRLTGFNRVLIYRFESDGVGVVVAEDGDGVLPSYLDLRFPASDIPRQARELYRLNRIRLIADAGYTPVPIVPTLDPATGAPLDLTYSALRSVSPVHLEYMRNMGTGASMSASIVVEGELWGLISCHNAEPKLAPARVRTACEFLAEMLALQIGARARSDSAGRRIGLKSLAGALVAAMAEEASFADGLVRHPEQWMAFGSATGAVVVTPETLLAVGRSPAPGEIRALVAWLERQDQDELFTTDRLSDVYPAAEAFAEFASGLLALRASKIHPIWVLWFRPEVARTVTWGGDPTKTMQAPDLRLHPRKSFAAWKEEVRARSAPWRGEEIEAAGDLRAAIIGVVLRGAEERAELSDQLQRSNKELEAFSYSISHDLRAPFRHIAGFAELLRERENVLDDKSRHYLQSIREAALSAGRLVDDLLNFSQIGRATLTTAPVDMDKLVVEARRTLSQETEGREIVWRVGDLPPAWGDGAMLRQVWVNLIANAVKYSRNARRAEIEIFSEESPQARVYGVRDNGVGFDMAYVGKLFGVFQRLHRSDEFEGTGIGLAISKRVVERHGGRVWAEGRLGEGAVFRFTLPRIETGKD